MPKGRPLKSVREDTLRCSCCTRWLKDTKFTTVPDKRHESRRGRHRWCNECRSLYSKFYYLHRKKAS